MNSAESAYLFRHALLRDAAYDLQPPGSRAALHALAFELIEQQWGGRAPAPMPPDHPDPGPMQPHATDTVAEELAEHASRAQVESNDDWQPLQCLYLHRAAEAAEARYRNDAARRCWLALAAQTHGARTAGALRRAAAILFATGRIAEASAELRLALTAARHCGASQLEGTLLGNVASTCFQLAQLDDAEQLGQQALAIQRRIGDCHGEGRTLSNLAILYQGVGRYAEAESAYAAALNIQSGPGQHRARAQTLYGQGTLYETSGRAAEAESAFLLALEVYRKEGDRRMECTILGSLANVMSERDRHQECVETYGQAIRIAREVGDMRLLGVLQGNLANQYHDATDSARALDMYVLALQIHRQTGNLRSEGIVLGNMAETLEQSGDVPAALRAYVNALEIHRKVRNTRVECAHGCAYAICLLKAGLPLQARDQWKQSFPGLKQSGDSLNTARLTNAMRLACAARGVPQLDEVAP